MRADDRAHEEWLIKEQRLTIRAMILTLAVCLAPFLVLPFGIDPALIVLGAGLLFTTWLCWSGGNLVGPVSRGKLRSMAIMNLIMAVVVIGIVLLRVL
jgi:hypothetical protein